MFILAFLGWKLSCICLLGPGYNFLSGLDWALAEVGNFLLKPVSVQALAVDTLVLAG